eukprot:gnl/Dysnectes_brevis/2176_a2535_2857.p1 GENE.gnl/Dysnectes_brevis/2176_a2535_2857~~gnl/Dysnectes_brevis/2176_a2535_2857.p1  ORF type:complete len:356 (+),score=97.94 gnl/Dysnectes_brevis/2176_a2535_2857:33-1070(+)
MAANIALFNGRHGFLEASIRSRRDQFLTNADYLALTQADTLADLQVALNTTYLAAPISSLHHLTPELISSALTDHMVSEFLDMKAHSIHDFHTFMEHVRKPFVIDNIILVLLGASQSRDSQAVLARCHPLGEFPGLATLASCGSAEEIYNSVLEESPVADLFQRITDIDWSLPEMLRAKLYRVHLESFHAFCTKVGGETMEIMGPLLEFDADRRTITLTLNLLGQDVSAEEKTALYPRLGHLYPFVHDQLAVCPDMDGVKQCVAGYQEYAACFDVVTSDPSKTLDDAFAAAEVEQLKYCILNQFNFGIAYSWLRLSEVQIKNLVWIAECIAQSRREMIRGYTPLW